MSPLLLAVKKFYKKRNDAQRRTLFGYVAQIRTIRRRCDVQKIFEAAKRGGGREMSKCYCDICGNKTNNATKYMAPPWRKIRLCKNCSMRIEYIKHTLFSSDKRRPDGCDICGAESDDLTTYLLPTEEEPPAKTGFTLHHFKGCVLCKNCSTELFGIKKRSYQIHIDMPPME